MDSRRPDSPPRAASTDSSTSVSRIEYIDGIDEAIGGRAGEAVSSEDASSGSDVVSLLGQLTLSPETQTQTQGQGQGLASGLCADRDEVEREGEREGEDDQYEGDHRPEVDGATRRLGDETAVGTVARLIRGASNIIVAVGAGISVASGIPDFRSKGTGLYDNLEKYNLPHPEAIFDIEFFRETPEPFYTLSKELYDPSYLPTRTHYFIRLLHEKGVLVRCYTQNIDSLESKAGVPKEAVIAAHGNFDSAYCIECGREERMQRVGEGILEGRVVYCSSESVCGGLVKPSIVFFGESLPARFWNSLEGDFSRADLLLVMGSSLVVQPFASLVERTNQGVPRVLINREAVGRWRVAAGAGENEQEGGDHMLLGDCDGMVEALCLELGWLEELRALEEDQ